MTNRYQTQWIGQFGVACELTRRNYLVSLPLGNAPIRDIICQSPNEKAFSIQVKSFRQKGFSPIGSLVEKEIQDLWFVFVFVPNRLEQALEYFVISHADLIGVWKQGKEEDRLKEQRRGKPYKEWAEGVYYKKLLGYKDNWGTLPV